MRKAKNLILSTDTAEMLASMAEKNELSKSAMIRLLILREAQRLGLNKQIRESPKDLEVANASAVPSF